MHNKKGILPFVFFTTIFLVSSSIFAAGGVSVDILFDKSFYFPDDTMNLKILNVPKGSKKIDIVVSKGIEKMYKSSKENNQSEPIDNISISVPSDIGGYGLDVFIDGKLLLSRGFLVLSSWIQSPRYGFLTDFDKSRINVDTNLDYLVQYHINSLQYYDWMYDYGYLVSEQDIYKDAWSRQKTISNTVLKELISKGHERNIYSMAYVPIYGVERNLGLKHPDWLLYQKNGDSYVPLDFYQKILITNTYKTSGWTQFLIDQCNKTLQFGFDGIHLDQYGYPKDFASMYLDNGQYKPYITSKGFIEFIDELKEKTKAPVLFNYVNNWPSEIQSQAKTDAIYIEPWESCNTYDDMAKMVNNAKEDSGKDVIIAAYIEYTYEHTIALTDAVILVNGGRRLELGEYKTLLSGPYFPADVGIPSEEFLKRLRNYYDFEARYKDFFDASEKDLQLIGSSLSLIPRKGAVYYNIKGNSKYVFINLINFSGVTTTLWRMETRKPELVMNLDITIPLANVRNVYFASADNQLAFSKLSFSKTEEGIRIKIPQIEYWSSVLIEVE